MDYGVQLAHLDFSELRDRAQAGEGQGYSVVTVPDHIVMEGPERSFDPKLLGAPEECVAELERRARDWDVSQVLFGGGLDAHTQRRLAEDVLTYV